MLFECYLKESLTPGSCRGRELCSSWCVLCAARLVCSPLLPRPLLNAMAEIEFPILTLTESNFTSINFTSRVIKVCRLALWPSRRKSRTALSTLQAMLKWNEPVWSARS